MSQNYKEKILMKFNVNQLDRILLVLINYPENKKFASNVQRLFKLFLDSGIDNEKEFRVYLINEVVDIILKNNIKNKVAVLDFIDTDGKYYNSSVELLNDLYEREIDEDEIAFLDRTISNQLKYSTILESSETLNEKLLNLRSENYDDLENAVLDIANEINSLNSDIHSARESIEDSKYDLSLSDGGFVSVLGKLIEKERNPSTRVQTGIQFLNSMLDGGFEKGRLYCALGVAKGWKSGFLLNCVSWAKRLNSLQSSDPTLKPVIVYLSMENTNEETIKRLWCHCFGNDSEIKNFDKVTVARMFEEAKLFTPNDPNSPELLIWYRRNRSINTADLSSMLDDLKTQGKECVFLVFDYLRRIRATEGNKDLRLELSNVTNELKTIAMEHDIPVVTCSQLNREAFRALEEADSFEEKIRASDKLGASNISESIDIIQNCDLSFIVNKMQKKQVNEAGETEFVDRYVLFKLIACRAKQPAITSFKHRMKDNNDMALIEDINLARPVSTSLETEFIKERINQNGQKTKGPRSIA